MNKQRIDRLARLESKPNRNPEEEGLRVALVGLRDAPKNNKPALEAAELAVKEAESAVEKA